MKKECYKIDEQGYIVEHYLLEEEEIPSDYITVLPQDGLYQPLRWNGTEWIEGLTQAEIDAIKNKPIIPTLEERNRADIDYIAIMTGVDL